MDEYLTVEEVATLLRTSPETVRYWRHVGKGPRSFKIGRRVLYASADVSAFIQSQQEGAAGSDPLAETETDDLSSFPPHLLAERIAQAIEESAEYEGVRAQRVIRACAHIAREQGRQWRA